MQFPWPEFALNYVLKSRETIYIYIKYLLSQLVKKEIHKSFPKGKNAQIKATFSS